MRLPDRKEAEVRGLLDAGPPAPVPADLAERALARGVRLAHRRRVLLGLLTVTLLAALAALALWTSLTDPFTPPPAGTTPPLGW